MNSKLTELSSQSAQLDSQKRNSPILNKINDPINNKV